MDNTDIVMVDLMKPKVKHIAMAQQKMSELKEGEEYTHCHRAYKVRFALWLAHQRSRLGKNFKHKKVSTYTYVIWVAKST